MQLIAWNGYHPSCEKDSDKSSSLKRIELEKKGSEGVLMLFTLSKHIYSWLSGLIIAGVLGL